MKKVRIILCACLVACVTLVTDAGAQDYKCLRTNTWSIYGQGGVSWATGLEFQNVNPSTATSIAPELGAGVNYNLRPWIRLGLNYEFSKYKREQRFNALQPVAPTLDIPGFNLAENNGGMAYRKMWTQYHNADFTIDFNVVQLLWNNRKSGRFNLYLGSGIGMMFANGNTYAIGMGDERWVDPNNYAAEHQVKDNWASLAWVTVDNNRHHFEERYVPIVLTAEYDVSSRVTLGVKGQYKSLISPEAALAPDALCAAAFVVRYNILGPRHGVSSYKRKYEELVRKYKE